MTLTTLNDVFADQIEDLYSAETQLVQALPKIAAGSFVRQSRTILTRRVATGPHPYGKERL